MREQAAPTTSEPAQKPEELSGSNAGDAQQIPPDVVQQAVDSNAKELPGMPNSGQVSEPTKKTIKITGDGRTHMERGQLEKPSLHSKAKRNLYFG